VTTRCGGGTDEKFHQSNPVVRLVGRGERMVQVNQTLYNVVCTTGDSRLDMSQGEHELADVKPFLSAMTKGSSGSSNMVKAAAVLSTLPPADFEAAKRQIIATADECHKNFVSTAGGGGTSGGRQ
jgi:hypothetical protein